MTRPEKTVLQDNLIPKIWDIVFIMLIINILKTIEKFQHNSNIVQGLFCVLKLYLRQDFKKHHSNEKQNDLGSDALLGSFGGI